MILADTSVWIDHFRSANPDLGARLDAIDILMHPFVLGELMLGGIPNERDMLLVLTGLPEAVVASREEVLLLIKSERLSGSGIGYVDAALLASLKLQPGTMLWTRDRRLAAVAEEMSVQFHPQRERSG